MEVTEPLPFDVKVAEISEKERIRSNKRVLRRTGKSVKTVSAKESKAEVVPQAGIISDEKAAKKAAKEKKRADKRAARRKGNS